MYFLNGKNPKESAMIKNRMKEFRARYNMKQEDLARKVGVRRETIGNLENGRYNPSSVSYTHLRAHET